VLLGMGDFVSAKYVWLLIEIKEVT
jgi:hypothetical protein